MEVFQPSQVVAVGSSTVLGWTVGYSEDSLADHSELPEYFARGVLEEEMVTK